MRKLILSLALVFTLVPFAYAATTEVKVKDNFFKPAEVTITKGDRVKWVWKGEETHNVALKKPGKNNIARSSEFKTEGTFKHKFRKVGTWKVLCELHPKMKMKVVVTNP